MSAEEFESEITMLKENIQQLLHKKVFVLSHQIFRKMNSLFGVFFFLEFHEKITRRFGFR